MKQSSPGSKQHFLCHPPLGAFVPSSVTPYSPARELARSREAWPTQRVLAGGCQLLDDSCACNHHAPCTMHHAPRITHHAPRMMHHHRHYHHHQHHRHGFPPPSQSRPTSNEREVQPPKTDGSLSDSSTLLESGEVRHRSALSCSTSAIVVPPPLVLQGRRRYFLYSPY